MVGRNAEVRQKTEDRALGLPLSKDVTKSIGEAGRSWSGKKTESSLSLRNKVGWCLISLLAIREVDEVIHCREGVS